ncbi:thiolase family protein [Ornithinimicrobium humiphilum]|uniref:Acetyl-CoA C-acetyltransferase n=1 Tax=Ornithinimicrobium humiphilum TaxID=125288 RepID=A0A543KRS1_9MICO|nr:thiolase family protein [Ornithinimicrobium humiphilum]TQM97776.1 acetyl-CoA C-acetyltransferase [Ornithinimicrobium humiphilum]
MQSAVIVEAVRTGTGRGKPGGGLSGVHAVELLRQTLEGLVDRSGIDPGVVEDVMIGCVSQGGEQAACPGRIAWLGAGYPSHVPATTIDRRCGSSQQAVHFAAQAIMSGCHDVVIAGGVESMSRVPMGSARGDADVFGPSVRERYAPGLTFQGVAAELVAAKWGISREEMDAYAVESHARAAEARRSGHFAREIVPVDLMDGTGATFTEDETIREGTTAQKLAGLPTVFRREEDEQRFPQIRWGVTPGNSSQLADGASALLVTSEQAAERLGLRPRARIISMSVIGDDPLLMLTGPIAATRMVLERAGLGVEDIDVAEVNEAFASVPLAWQREIGLPFDRLNPRGGAIALGHPLGASGTRLMTTLLNHLEATGGRYGLQAMCEGSGMANATIIERL